MAACDDPDCDCAPAVPLRRRIYLISLPTLQQRAAELATLPPSRLLMLTWLIESAEILYPAGPVPQQWN